MMEEEYDYEDDDVVLCDEGSEEKKKDEDENEDEEVDKNEDDYGENKYGRSIARKHEEIKFEWKIPDFISIAEDYTSSTYSSERFFFAGLRWYLQLVKDSKDDHDYKEFHLCTDSQNDIIVEYNLFLENSNGEMEKLVWGTQHIKENKPPKPLCFTLSEIQERESELAPSGIVAITCTMKCLTTEPNVSGEPKLKKLRRLETLSQNFKHLFENKESCDTTLLVKNKQFRAHRAVLIARSSVFGAMFLHETSSKQTGLVDISDCDPDSFEMFLRYLYCGTLEGISSAIALHLYETSKKYDVQELKTFCKDYLCMNLTVNNLCDIVTVADKHKDAELLSEVQDFFNKNFPGISDTLEWKSLNENNFFLAKKLLKNMYLKLTSGVIM